jgi:glycosyltransferase involved in cell wall biosynthesis
MGKKGKDRNEIAREKARKKTFIIYSAPINKTTGNGKIGYFLAKVIQARGDTVYTIGNDYNHLSIYFKNIPVLPSFHCETCGLAYQGSTENVEKIAEYINLFKPDYFICIGDPLDIQQRGIGNMTFENMKKTKVIFYGSLDSEGILTNDSLVLDGKRDYLEVCDKIVYYSRFGQQQFKKWTGQDTDMIHAPVNFGIYSPVTSSQKNEIREKHRFKSTDFIMYYSGRNIMRKRPHILLEGICQFLCETKDTYLYLNIPLGHIHNTLCYPDNLNPLDFIKRVMKKKYSRDLVEEGRIIFLNRGNLGSTELNEQENAELYQLSDLYVCSTSAEGLHLPPIESLGCGVPAVIPFNSTCEEVLGKIVEEKPDFYIAKGGLLTKTPIDLYNDFNLKQRITTPELIYSAVKFMYDNPEIRERLGKEGHDYVKEVFEFGKFAQKWDKVFDSITKKEIKKEEDFKTLKITKNSSEEEDEKSK